MAASLRIVLIISAVIVLSFVIRKTRKSKFSATDAIFWLVLALCLVICAVVPQIVYASAKILGIQSPSNLVFLGIIALLLIKEFMLQTEVADLKRKLVSLTQEIAIRDYEDE